MLNMKGMYNQMVPNGLAFGVYNIQGPTLFRLNTATIAGTVKQIVLDPSVKEDDWIIIEGNPVYFPSSINTGIDWTSIYSFTQGKFTYKIYAKRINNFDIALGSIYFFSTVTISANFTISYQIIRPYIPISTIGFGGWSGQYSTTTPTNITISASGQSLPVLVMGFADTTTQTGTSIPGFSPAADIVNTINPGGGWGYKIYNSNAASNHTLSYSGANGSANFLIGGYLTFNFISGSYTAGTKLFNTPGSWSFTVPSYQNSFTIKICGAGGGGGARITNTGSPGTATTCTQLSWSAGGGAGGLPNNGNGGAGGTNTGTADTSTAGPAGQKGGGIAMPVSGGTSIFDPGLQSLAIYPALAPSPAGSGGFGSAYSSSGGGGGGGAGGSMVKTYTLGGISPGTVLSGIIGTGGNGAPAGTAAGENGKPGGVYFNWT